MAKQISTSTSGGPGTPDPNEIPGVLDRPRRRKSKLAPMDSFKDLPEQVLNQTELVNKATSTMKLEEAYQLMKDVQQAQRNLTEVLNNLALYRRAVARILEMRRKEAAQSRRNLNKKDTSEEPMGTDLEDQTS